MYRCYQNFQGTFMRPNPRIKMVKEETNIKYKCIDNLFNKIVTDRHKKGINIQTEMYL